jgi:hypothetical protein
MILARRKVHFFSFIVLACIVPLLFFIGIFFRPDYGIVSDSAKPLFVISGASSVIEQSSNRLINSTELIDAKIQLKVKTLLTNIEGKKIVILEVEPTKLVKIPDPLLYWQTGNEKPTQITENAFLLGSLAGTSSRKFILPPQAINQKGQLIVFSQGYNKISAIFPL